MLTPKNVVSWMPESFCFRTLFWSQRVNGFKTLLKCARRCFYAILPRIANKSSTKTSLLLRSETLRLSFNRLTNYQTYSHLSREIFQQLVRTQLSWKTKTFSPIFIAFSKSTWSFNLFEKKDELYSWNISEVLDTKECGFLNVRKLLLQNTLLKSTS